MISEEAKRLSAQCRHYAMCKIDFLGTGLCPSGANHHYVSYYPQGRMDICNALANNLIPVTEGLLDVNATCTLCGICDRQCSFVTGMRPGKVMKALKEHVNTYLEQGGFVIQPPADPVLAQLRTIVGNEWATNDPAHLVAYSNDPFPLQDRVMPAYVVLPGSQDEVSGIVKLASSSGVPYAVRGNGGSVFGLVFTQGIVIDMNRMKSVVIDPENWTAIVGPGVTSFQLQTEAQKYGLRANVAEAAATVCGNMVCTGIFSTWSAAYGVGADNLIDARFVNAEGEAFGLNSREAPNLLSFSGDAPQARPICTEARIRLYPTTSDEEGFLVPFSNLEGAVSFSRNLSVRRIGLAVAVLGGHYLSTFISPTKELAFRFRSFLIDTLGVDYMVFVIGDKYAQDAIKTMGRPVINQGLFRRLLLGLPELLKEDLVSLLGDYEGGEPLLDLFCREEMGALLEAMLSPSPANLAKVVDEDLRDFYAALYSRPEMTDLVWLNAFRIVSPRMARHKHAFAFLVYLPLDRTDRIEEVNRLFKQIADNNGIDNDFGFLTPIDFGKRGILEYDYYIDHTDRSEAQKIGRALAELDPAIDRLIAGTKGMMSMKYIFSHGIARKESYLYR